MGQGDNTMSEVREAVRLRYANVAKQLVVFNQPGSGPGGCCQADGPDCGCSGSYSAEALQEIGLTESVSLGCGNPTMLAELRPGETVLDLGSGAGLDVLLSARRVAPGGRFAVADMVELEPLEPADKQALDKWAGCISGTIPISEYRNALVTAGFADVDFEIHATENMPGIDGKVGSAYIRARKPLM